MYITRKLLIVFAAGVGVSIATAIFIPSAFAAGFFLSSEREVQQGVLFMLLGVLIFLLSCILASRTGTSCKRSLVIGPLSAILGTILGVPLAYLITGDIFLSISLSTIVLIEILSSKDFRIKRITGLLVGASLPIVVALAIKSVRVIPYEIAPHLPLRSLLVFITDGPLSWVSVVYFGAVDQNIFQRIG